MSWHRDNHTIQLLISHHFLLQLQFHEIWRKQFWQWHEIWQSLRRLCIRVNRNTQWLSQFCVICPSLTNACKLLQRAHNSQSHEIYWQKHDAVKMLRAGNIPSVHMQHDTQSTPVQIIFHIVDEHTWQFRDSAFEQSFDEPLRPSCSVFALLTGQRPQLPPGIGALAKKRSCWSHDHITLIHSGSWVSSLWFNKWVPAKKSRIRIAWCSIIRYKASRI